MRSRDFLKKVAEENLECFAKKGYKVGSTPISFNRRMQSSSANTDILELSTINTQSMPSGLGLLEVNNLDCIVAAEKLINEWGSACLLNFASAKNPGGGFLKGSMAQEEAICYKTTLYAILSELGEHYSYSARNTHKGLYMAWSIYTPDIVIFRDENFKFKLPSICSVITCPAVNAGVASKCGLSETTIYTSMAERCRLVLNTAVVEGEKNLVLGPFGCGVFKNNPTNVANIFKGLLLGEGYLKYFDKVVFACYGSRVDSTYLTFKRVLVG